MADKKGTHQTKKKIISWALCDTYWKKKTWNSDATFIVSTLSQEQVIKNINTTAKAEILAPCIFIK